MNIPNYLRNNEELSRAIRLGFLDNYDENWESTFVGVFLTKHPQQTKLLCDVCTATGKKIPTWKDLTDQNLKTLRRIVLTHVCPNSAALYFRQMCAIINDNRMEVEIPSTRYAEILKVRIEPSQAVFLTANEIRKLHEFVPRTLNEHYVKRIFMISALTGCRHSDAERLSLDDIDETSNTITYISQKTRIEATLPVHVWLREYLAQKPHRTEMHISTFNRNIQDICQACGINERVKIFHGGKEQVGEKWQFVTSHTARRSFCTNLFRTDLDLLTISRLAGHTNVDMTSRYVIGQKELPAPAQKFFQAK